MTTSNRGTYFLNPSPLFVQSYVLISGNLKLKVPRIRILDSGNFQKLLLCLEMGYEEIWTALADLVAELREKGETIPVDVMKNLRSARTMIQILKADPTHTENIPRVETYLESVEFHLISAAQERFGTEYVEQWMKKLEEARRKIPQTEQAVSRFVPGVPRGKRWVRVHVSDETPQRDIEELAEGNRLSYKMQEGGYVLVYGKNTDIKSFVKKMAEKFRSARKAMKNASNS